MAEKTEIAWCDSTWSPWEGCQKVSLGCDHCYAEGMNRWLRKGANWGPGAPRREYSDEHWEKPLRWNQAAKKAGKRLRVFPSVCDPFDNAVAPEWRARFFDLIGRTHNLDWLLLTKRIGNAAKMLPWTPEGGANSLMASSEVWSNVWLGATIVNQEEADRDIPKLLAVPARVRFLSMEPLLGPVDLRDTMHPDGGGTFDALHPAGPQINWVIVGGESGPGARPMHPQWAQSLRDQCKAAAVPFHFKQWGEWTPGENVNRHSGTVETATLQDDRWLLSRENLATADGHIDDQPDVYRIGKKAAGRLLDGVEHNQFPEK
jgi:protein gp37